MRQTEAKRQTNRQIKTDKHKQANTNTQYCFPSQELLPSENWGRKEHPLMLSLFFCFHKKAFKITIEKLIFYLRYKYLIIFWFCCVSTSRSETAMKWLTYHKLSQLLTPSEKYCLANIFFISSIFGWGFFTFQRTDSWCFPRITFWESARKWKALFEPFWGRRRFQVSSLFCLRGNQIPPQRVLKETESSPSNSL